MKGAIAMMVAAMMRARLEGTVPPGDVILAVLSDEENTSALGAEYLVNNHPSVFQSVNIAIGEFGGYTSYIGKRRSTP